MRKGNQVIVLMVSLLRRGVAFLTFQNFFPGFAIMLSFLLCNSVNILQYLGRELKVDLQDWTCGCWRLIIIK